MRSWAVTMCPVTGSGTSAAKLSMPICICWIPPVVNCLAVGG